MVEISKEEFEEFVRTEFPGREFRWEYDAKTGGGYFYVQAGIGKYSADELRYVFIDGRVRFHIEGDEWWRLRQKLYNRLSRHKELHGAVWNKRQNCQWILSPQKKDIFDMFRQIRDIVEPEIINDEESSDVVFSQKSINEILTFNLNIPDYQRIYCWEEPQVITLLNDIENITTSSLYLGNIILCKNDEKYDIVDGQQRLVTLAIIRHILGESGKEKIKLLDSSFESLEARLHIISNAKTISEYLKDKNRKENVEKNINKIKVGVLIIDNKNLDLSFKFFNNSNSRGKRLTDYDLLKPHHLRYIPVDYEAQQELYAAQWDKMIDSCKTLTDNAEDKGKRLEADYIHVIELYLYRLRHWARTKAYDEYGRFIYPEFKSAPYIDEIPPFGEKFNYYEPIQGGQHFFEYIEHFVQKYREFTTSKAVDNNETNVYRILCNHFTGYSDRWYRYVMEALVFCYYLKFGNRFIYEAALSIVRYIAQIRFEKGRAYEPTIINYAKNTGIVLMIEQATSPTFFLAEIENIIKRLNRIGDLEGIRKSFLDKCKSVSDELSKYCISKTFCISDNKDNKYNYYSRTRYEGITSK